MFGGLFRQEFSFYAPTTPHYIPIALFVPGSARASCAPTRPFCFHQRWDQSPAPYARQAESVSTAAGGVGNNRSRVV